MKTFIIEIKIVESWVTSTSTLNHVVHYNLNKKDFCKSLKNPEILVFAKTCQPIFA
jgi:hypothetical protein